LTDLDARTAVDLGGVIEPVGPVPSLMDLPARRGRQFQRDLETLKAMMAAGTL
jgi:hypothetical protein